MPRSLLTLMDGSSPVPVLTARQPPKASDLSQYELGTTSKTTPNILWSQKHPYRQNGNRLQEPSSTNALVPLRQVRTFSQIWKPKLETVVETSTSKGNRPPSVVLGTGTPSDPPPQRRRLQLLPRSTPVVSKSGWNDETTGETDLLVPLPLSEAENRATIKEDAKEFCIRTSMRPMRPSRTSPLFPNGTSSLAGRRQKIH